MIAIQGIKNLRDIGSYSTANGRSLKRGCIYRSAVLTDLEESGLEKFKSLNIKTVCDLRNEREAKEFHNRLHLSCGYTLLNFDILTTIEKNSGLELDWKDLLQVESLNPNQVMLEIFEAFVLNATNTFSDLIKWIAQKDSSLPLLIHCQGGKDRTGIAAALILLILGVDEKDVIEDFMLSKKALHFSEEEIKKYSQKYAIHPKKMETMLDTRKEWLEHAFSKIKEKYGSYDEYFERGLNISKEERQALEEKLLL